MLSYFKGIVDGKKKDEDHVKRPPLPPVNLNCLGSSKFLNPSRNVTCISDAQSADISIFDLIAQKYFKPNGPSIEEIERLSAAWIFVQNNFPSDYWTEDFILHYYNVDPRYINQDCSVLGSVDERSEPDLDSTLSTINPPSTTHGSELHFPVFPNSTPSCLMPQYGDDAIAEASMTLNLAQVDALFTLIRSANTSLINIIQEERVNVTNCCDRNNVTILHVACEFDDVAAVQYICEMGADPVATDRWGRLPLHCACSNGLLNNARYLILELGCDPLVVTAEGYTCAHNAARGNHVHVLAFLESLAPALIMASTKGGVTPLLLACKQGHVETVQFLVDEAGADSMSRDSNGVDCLSMACWNGHLHICRYLLSLDARRRPSMETRSIYGYTCLHYASLSGRIDLVRTLLERGAEATAQDLNGMVAADLTSDRDIKDLLMNFRKGFLMPPVITFGEQQQQQQQIMSHSFPDLSTPERHVLASGNYYSDNNNSSSNNINNAPAATLFDGQNMMMNGPATSTAMGRENYFETNMSTSQSTSMPMPMPIPTVSMDYSFHSTTTDGTTRGGGGGGGMSASFTASKLQEDRIRGMLSNANANRTGSGGSGGQFQSQPPVTVSSIPHESNHINVGNNDRDCFLLPPPAAVLVPVPAVITNQQQQPPAVAAVVPIRPVMTEVKVAPNTNTSSNTSSSNNTNINNTNMNISTATATIMRSKSSPETATANNENVRMSGNIIRELKSSSSNVLDNTSKQQQQQQIDVMAKSLELKQQLLSSSSISSSSYPSTPPRGEEQTMSMSTGSASGSESGSTSPLSEGWLEFLDQASGCIYYHNPSTGLTQWERPVPASVVKENSSGPNSHSQQQQQQQQEQSIGSAVTQEAIAYTVSGNVSGLQSIIIAHKANIKAIRDDQGRSLLHLACKHNRTNSVKFLAEDAGVDPDVQDDRGWTAVHVACHEGHLSAVRYLCDRGATSLRGDHTNSTPLHEACSAGHLDVAQHLISVQSCDPVARNDVGYTCIHSAVHNNHIRLVRFLVAATPFSVFTVTVDGSTPLLLACKQGHVETARFLVDEAGADSMSRDSNGVDCLSMACWNGHLHICRYLLSLDDNRRPSMETRSACGYTCLHYASLSGRIDIIRELLDRGANATVQDLNGKMAADLTSDRAIKTLLSDRGNIRSYPKSPPRGEEQTMSMSTGSASGSESGSSSPLSEGWLEFLDQASGCIYYHNPSTGLTQWERPVPASVVEENSSGQHLSVVGGGVGNGSARGSAIDCMGNQGGAITQEAIAYASAGDMRALYALLGTAPTIKANVNQMRDERGRMPLHHACKHGQIRAIQFLVEGVGAEVDAVDHDGWSSLHFACAGNHALVVRYLVKLCGADVTLRDFEGRLASALVAQSPSVSEEDNIARIISKASKKSSADRKRITVPTFP